MSLYTDIRNGLRNLSDIPSLVGVPLQKVYEFCFGPTTFLASDYGTFAAAVTAIGSTPAVLKVNSTQVISTAVTVPSTLRVEVVDRGIFIKSGSGTLTFNGKFVAPIAQVFSGFAAGNVTGLVGPYPQWFGAAFDSTTNDYTAWACAIASTSAGPILFTPGTSLIETGLVIPASKWISGDGIRASILQYSGTGYAITFGSTSSADISYGCGGKDYTVLLTANGGNGIKGAGTGDLFLENVYVEGIPTTTTGKGVVLDGAVSSNLFSTLRNIHVNHVKFPFELSSSGVGFVTSALFENCEGLSDSIAGSVGFNVIGSNCDGCRILGGNLESIATSLRIEGLGLTVFGLRFEGNTTDINLISTARRNSIIGCYGLDTITDGASDISNSFVSNTPSSGSNQTRNLLQQLSIGGGLTDTTPGVYILENTGSAMLNLERTAATAGKYSFTVTSGGALSIDNAGIGNIMTIAHSDSKITFNSPLISTAVAFASLGTPVDGTLTYCSDCVIAALCIGGGTGAFAKRLAGAWVCN